MSRAFLFPGQGSQVPGMGEDLFPLFPDLVAEADEILGYSVADLCLSDDPGRLGRTEFTQPALYFVSCLQALVETGDGGVSPAFVAGHSVGEYAALRAAGAVSFGDGLRLVAKRGEIMAKVSGGGMAAVIGLEPDVIRGVLDDAGAAEVDLANFNSSGQTVVSGPVATVSSLADTFKEAGARLYVPLKVSGAFHSRMMEEPSLEFAAFLEDFTFADPAFPVVSNVEALPHPGASAIPGLLVRQIRSPVRWTDTITWLRKAGADEFLECGPGSVLTKLLRQIP